MTDHFPQAGEKPWPLFPLGLLVLSAFCGNYSRIALGPFQETVRTTLSLTDNQMAIVQGPAIAIPMALVAIPLGMAVDRISRVRILLLLVVGCVIGGLLTAIATGFVQLVAARTLIGLTAGTINIAAYSILADLFPPERRGRAKSVVVVGYYLGASAAFATAAALLALTAGSSDGWRLSMAWMTVPAIVAGFALLMLREPARTGITSGAPGLAATVAQLSRYRQIILPLATALVAIEVPLAATWIWASPILIRTYAASQSEVAGIIAVAMLVSGMAGPLLGGLISDYFQRRGSLSTMVAFAAVDLVAALGSFFVFAPSLYSSAVILTAFMTGISAAFSMGITLFTILVPNELRGLCLALLSAAAGIVGFAIAPVLVSLLSGVLGGSAAIGFSLLVVNLPACLLGAAAILVGRRIAAGMAN